MEVNSQGLVVVGVFCQGIMCSEELEQHLEKTKLLNSALTPHI